MNIQTKTPSQKFNKQYSIAIETDPLPEIMKYVSNYWLIGLRL